MKTRENYEAPQLHVAAIGVEQGFAASASAIENPVEVAEPDDFWN